MPAKRKYNIKGTNDFIVLAAIFFFLCLWAVKDAWYPSAKTIKNHPQELELSFETHGFVQKVYVDEGDAVGEGMRLARLRVERTEEKFEGAKKAYAELKLNYAKANDAVKKAKAEGTTGAELKTLEEKRVSKKAEMAQQLVKVNELRLSVEGAELISSTKGAVKEVRIKTHSRVEPGETVILIDPKDHFYLFNKSLAIFSFFAFWIFLAVHVLAR